MTFAMICLFALGALQMVAATVQTDAAFLDNGAPIQTTRVANLLKEMKAQVEEEAELDKELYDKYNCWCETNTAAKNKEIEDNTQIIAEKESYIEYATSLVSKLTVEIEGHTAESGDHHDALEKAEGLRAKEHAEFLDKEAFLKEAVENLREAIVVLSKVQLAQMRGTSSEASLVQVNRVLESVKNTMNLPAAKGASLVYRNVIQRDLWDMLGATAPLMQGGQDRPVMGLNQQPNNLEGAAAGAKSYNSRSGQILGMLKQMAEGFENDLSYAQKDELAAEIAFQTLKANKMTQIQTCTGAIKEKGDTVAETNAKAAQAKEDLEAAKEQKAAAEKYLAEMTVSCEEAAKAYAIRVKTRMEEIEVIEKVIEILMDDENRDLFQKTTAASFLQINAAAGTGARFLRQGEGTEMRMRRSAAAQRLLGLARQEGANGWKLAMLAVRAESDVFEKIFKLMDELIAELKQQQADEVVKRDNCAKEIQDNDMAIMKKTSEKEDIEGLITDLTGTIEDLTQSIDQLKVAVSDAQIALKRASEDRKAENHDFQQEFAEQTATAQILKKALAKLTEFYGDALLQRKTMLTSRHDQPSSSSSSSVSISVSSSSGGSGSKAVDVANKMDLAPIESGPTTVVSTTTQMAPPPSKGLDYGKSKGAGGVMEFLKKIIHEAEVAAQEAITAEGESQKAYESFVSNTNDTVDGLLAEINEKTIALEKANGELVLAKKDLSATTTALGELQDMNKALHEGCDFVMKNFQVRQKARGEEIEAIQGAKAILRGAK